MICDKCQVATKDKYNVVFVFYDFLCEWVFSLEGCLGLGR